MHPIRRVILPLLVALVPLAAACNDPNELPQATQNNFVDTLTLFALTGTPVQTPSGYSVPDGPVRTDRTSSFDFAYDVEISGTDTTRHFLPQGVLDLGATTSVIPGLQLRSETFDQVDEAPSNGYVTLQKVEVDSGQVYVVRSRLVCVNLGVSLYSKLEILSFDDSARTVDFKVLANTNCGYKELTPGVPNE
jgi:hypothetical protein